MFANIVSPPTGGTSRASSIVPIGGRSRYTVSLCQMPPKFTVSCGQLRDRDDLGEAVDALHERVLDRLADAAREREELVGSELLVAEEHDEVLEPGRGGSRRPVSSSSIAREVDAADLGAERAREWLRP